MRIIVAGSRTARSLEVENALRLCPWSSLATVIVSGTAKGADLYGESWARSRRIAVRQFPADWEAHGRKAGPIRNRSMAEYADGLIAVWDGKSRGTKNMIDTALQLGLRLFVYRTDTQDTLDHAATGILADGWEHVEERAAVLEFDAELPRIQAERTASASVVVRPERPPSPHVPKRKVNAEAGGGEKIGARALRRKEKIPR